MTNSKKANGLFLTMTVCIICFYLFGKGLVTALPVSIRLISSEIVYLIPVLLCLLIGRDSIGKLIPHRVPRISTGIRSEENTSELQSRETKSYADF